MALPQRSDRRCTRYGPPLCHAIPERGGGRRLCGCSTSQSLHQQTRLWRDTWYDSTLPYWFLDRTMLNTSILASSTCHRFASGRFYGWEGVGCCAGTCTHVWQYAQAVARLFPALERDLRERTDFGLAFDAATGIIRFRAEGAGLAIDGQSGCILRSYREHQMSPDDKFLKRNWPKIKRAVQCLIEKDADGNGILESNQHNTLDTDWYGPVAWLSGMYIWPHCEPANRWHRRSGTARLPPAAARSASGDRRTWSRSCSTASTSSISPIPTIWMRSTRALAAKSIRCSANRGPGRSVWAACCPQPETLSALKSLWRYNFTPDVGPYREAHKPGRWYAMPGEAGLLMCTFPRSDWDYAKAAGQGRGMGRGLLQRVHEWFRVPGGRTHDLGRSGAGRPGRDAGRARPLSPAPSQSLERSRVRRSLRAVHGQLRVFLAACGFEYHGPRGHIGFAPRLTPGQFPGRLHLGRRLGNLPAEDRGCGSDR